MSPTAGATDPRSRPPGAARSPENARCGASRFRESPRGATRSARRRCGREWARHLLHKIQGHRSDPSHSWRHIENFLGATKPLTKIRAEDLNRYVVHRLGLDGYVASQAPSGGDDSGRKIAERGTVLIELALLHRVYTLASSCITRSPKRVLWVGGIFVNLERSLLYARLPQRRP